MLTNEVKRKSSSDSEESQGRVRMGNQVIVNELELNPSWERKMGFTWVACLQLHRVQLALLQQEEGSYGDAAGNEKGPSVHMRDVDQSEPTGGIHASPARRHTRRSGSTGSLQNAGRKILEIFTAMVGSSHAEARPECVSVGNVRGSDGAHAHGMSRCSEISQKYPPALLLMFLIK